LDRQALNYNKIKNAGFWLAEGGYQTQTVEDGLLNVKRKLQNASHACCRCTYTALSKVFAESAFAIGFSHVSPPPPYSSPKKKANTSQQADSNLIKPY
jgi:hypothetical protein